MKKIIIVSVFALVLVMGTVSAQTVPFGAAGISGAVRSEVLSIMEQLARSISGGSSGSVVAGAVPPATPINQLPAGYSVSTDPNATNISLNSLRVLGNRGDGVLPNFDVTYPAGGTLAGMRGAMLDYQRFGANMGSFWTALYGKAGGAANQGNRALYTDGIVQMMNGNVVIGIENPLNQDSMLHVGGSIRSDGSLYGQRLCIGGGPAPCTNSSGVFQGAWCGMQTMGIGLGSNSFKCKGLDVLPGNCPTGFNYTLVSSTMATCVGG